MQKTQTAVLPVLTWRERVHDLGLLIKFKLTLLVVFSAAFGYAMASPFDASFNWTGLLLISLGGFLVTGSSNGINQVIEKDYDRLMTRTLNRPVATGRMPVSTAVVVSLLLGLSGVVILGQCFNQLTAWLALGSLLSYAFIYTPLKRISPISVVIGALPGAMPPLLGWTAVTGEIDAIGLSLFFIQFLWQFPHFWSIAWVLDDDYKKAGFKMLPASGRNAPTAMQTLVFSLLLLPAGIAPFYFGYTGMVSAIVLVLSAAFMIWRNGQLLRDCSIPSAKRLMFASFLYLPIIQLALVFDKL